MLVLDAKQNAGLPILKIEVGDQGRQIGGLDEVLRGAFWGALVHLEGMNKVGFRGRTIVPR